MTLPFVGTLSSRQDRVEIVGRPISLCVSREIHLIEPLAMLTRREFLELSIEVTMAGTFAAGCGLGGPAVTDQIFHRPWPLPQTRWVLSMRWHDLLVSCIGRFVRS